MPSAIGLVALPLAGALLAIAAHQIALGRADRTYYFAASWSLWSMATVLSYWLAHSAVTPSAVVAASRVFYTVIASGLPVAVALVRNLYVGEADPRAMRRWYALAIATALAPLVIHLAFPEHIIEIEDLLAGPSRFATVGMVGGLVMVPAAPVLIRIWRWLDPTQTQHAARIRVARMMLPVFGIVIANDLLVLLIDLRSILLFPFVASLQAFVLHGLLVSESSQMYRHLEEAVQTRTVQLEAQRRELARAFENLRTVISGLPDGVLVVEADRIELANAAAERLLGCRGAELVGKPLRTSVPAEPIRALAGRTLELAERVGPLAVTLPVEPDRRATVVELEVDALGIELDGKRSTLVIMRDVTEAARMREQLLRGDRLSSLGTLVAGLAHEINNPLAYVLSNAEFVRHQLDDVVAGGTPEGARVDDSHRALSEAIDGALRIQTIIEGMQAFSRPEVANVTEIDLHDVVADALKLTRHAIEHQARLELQLDAVPVVRANRARLGQVAVNLIVNAMQAARSDGSAELKIVTRTDDHGDARLEIHDNGLGMSREVLARAFDPFFTTKAVGAGTGLGLSICHGIATAFGGRLELESVEGEGTVATLVVPASATAVASPVAVPPAVAPAPQRKAQVLIIDDDPQVARGLSRVLRGHDVRIATDLAQIEAALAAGDFDLILCDLMMPGVTGMDLYERLDRDAPRIASRMTFMTGGAFTAQALAFVEKMGERCLTKPIPTETLRDLVTRSLPPTDLVE